MNQGSFCQTNARVWNPFFQRREPKTQRVSVWPGATKQGWDPAKSNFLTSRLKWTVGSSGVASLMPGLGPGAQEGLNKYLMSAWVDANGVSEPHSHFSQRQLRLHFTGGRLRPVRLSKSLEGVQGSETQPSGSWLGCHPPHYVAFLTRIPFKVAPWLLS